MKFDFNDEMLRVIRECHIRGLFAIQATNFGLVDQNDSRTTSKLLRVFTTVAFYSASDLLKKLDPSIGRNKQHFRESLGFWESADGSLD